jgi:Retroviral aspartyl protease
MIFKAPQAPLKIQYSSPANPDLLSDSRPKSEVKSHAMEPLEISSLEELPTTKPLILKGTLNHAPISILIDSGATGNFISQQAVDHFSFSIDSVPSISIVFANGAKGVCNKAATAAYLCFQDHEEKINLWVVSLPKHDIIFGKPWLEK